MGRSKKRYHGVSDDKKLEEHFLNMLSKLRVTSGPPRGHIERLAWSSWEAKLHVDETVAKLIKRPTVITELHQCVLRQRQDMKEWSRAGGFVKEKDWLTLGTGSIPSSTAGCIQHPSVAMNARNVRYTSKP